MEAAAAIAARSRRSNSAAADSRPRSSESSLDAFSSCINASFASFCLRASVSSNLDKFSRARHFAAMAASSAALALAASVSIFSTARARAVASTAAWRACDSTCCLNKMISSRASESLALPSETSSFSQMSLSLSSCTLGPVSSAGAFPATEVLLTGAGPPLFSDAGLETEADATALITLAVIASASRSALRTSSIEGRRRPQISVKRSESTPPGVETSSRSTIHVSGTRCTTPPSNSMVTDDSELSSDAWALNCSWSGSLRNSPRL
mmetsp:Transcript_55158/g.145597  ORF Transcript_55158/g.145597 Transcript_55158/m.145597 type:complete len:267 (-) Transcript_55158:1133-1933(-)